MKDIITNKDIERVRRSLEEARKDGDLKRTIFLESTLASYTDGRSYRVEGYKYQRDDVWMYADQRPTDLLDPESELTAIEYSLPESFSEKAKLVWEYLDGAGFIFEYKGRLVITDESLYLTEAGDGIHEAIGCPRFEADSWEEIERWLELVWEDVKDDIITDDED